MPISYVLYATKCLNLKMYYANNKLHLHPNQYLQTFTHRESLIQKRQLTKCQSL